MSGESINLKEFCRRQIGSIDRSYRDPLEKALNLLIKNQKVRTTPAVWEQMLPCLELKDHLPPRVFNQLLVESAVPEIVMDPKYDFIQTERGTGVLIHPGINEKTALDYTHRFEWYREGILLSTGFRHQTKMAFLFDVKAG